MLVAVLRRSLRCALALAFALGAAQARADALRDARSAYQANVGGDIDESIRLYSKAIDTGELSRENLAIAFNNRGIAYRAKDLQDQAIEDYDTAILLMPDYAYAYYNRGNARKALGRHALAIDDYDEAIGLDPNDHEAYGSRAAAAEVVAAAKAIDQAGARGRECEAHFYVGQYHLIRGERDAAIRAFEAAVETGASTFIEFVGARAELARANDFD